MKRTHIYSYVLLLLVSYLHADTITLYNKTMRDVYAAIYYQDVPYYVGTPTNGQRATPIICIEAQTSVSLDRPERKWGYDRQLVFSEYDANLADQLTAAQFNNLHAKNIGNIKGDTFYIGDDDGELYAYTVLEWKVIEAPLAYAQTTLLNMIPAIMDNPYKNTVATIRTGNQLCAQERSHRFLRLSKIKHTLDQLYGKSYDKKVPTISVACSGGGYRAMLYALGALKALEQTNYLDLCSYVVGLSGSTWAIGTWLSSGKTVQAVHDWIIGNIELNMKSIDLNDLELIKDVMLSKYCAGQPVGLVDIYGACIANDLFDFFAPNKSKVYLSQQANRIEDGSVPFPLYTSISAETNKTEHLWYEFSPYEVGANWLDYYIPTWAFGRKFKSGKSVSFAPEQPMSTLLGTFGLAVGITFKYLLVNELDVTQIKLPIIQNILKRVIAHYGNDRPISAEYFNMSYGITDAVFDDVRIAHLVDAGINFNLPYPPISGLRPERKSDIIIFIDASAGTVGQELKNVEHYARYHKLPFPKIDYTNIDKKAVSVFNDNDPNTPIVIYVPRVVDNQLLAQIKNDSDYAELYNNLCNFDIEKCISDEACNTFNFFYTKDQARRLTALGEFNTLMMIEALKKILFST